MSRRRRHRVAIGVVAALTVLAFASPAFAAPPANDDFDSPTVLGSLPFTQSFSLNEATSALDDPVCRGFLNHSVWYSFVSPTNTRLQVDVSASPGDVPPVACVYTGSRGTLSAVERTHWSETRFRFNAAGGTTYFLLLVNYYTTFNPTTFTVIQAPPPPANDDFDHAAVIGSLPFSQALDTTEATVEVDEPEYSFCGGSSVWYTFTPAHDMRMTATADGTGFAFDPNVSAWTGPRNALVSASDASDLHCSGIFEFEAHAGTTYFVVARNFQGIGGQLEVSLDGDLRTTLALTTSRKTLDYGQTVKITAHLADFADLTVKTVSIYKTPFYGPKTLVKTGAVDSHGNLAIVVKPTMTTTFVANWAGESGWLPQQSPNRAAKVRAVTTAKLLGFYGTSGAYKLYHAGDNPKVVGTVVPNHRRHYLRFIAQVRKSGNWRPLDTHDFLIRSNGSATAYLINPPIGTVRVKTYFVSDGNHAADGSVWHLLRVR